MEGYFSEPSTCITRADGSVMRLYRSKSDPNAYMPVLDDEVFNFTEHLQKCMDEGNLKGK